MICGGAISGYSATGTWKRQSTPAITVTMEITKESFGRSMKILEIMIENLSPLYFAGTGLTCAPGAAL